MNQDYRNLTQDEHEALEKQSLRTIVQALQEYSKEAKFLFETTPTTSEAENIVLAEDLVQYALEVSECYPINRRFAGFIDYKRIRWLSTPFGLFPQVLLVDAKASTENNRETLQQSQLVMDAEFRWKNTTQVVTLTAGVPPRHVIDAAAGTQLLAVTTSVFIHFYYTHLRSTTQPFRRLNSIYAILLPHQILKDKYNPNPDRTFFGSGKHSPARKEAPRIRVYFEPLRKMCPWRLQELHYRSGSDYTEPLWRDYTVNELGHVVEQRQPFHYIGR